MTESIVETKVFIRRQVVSYRHSLHFPNLYAARSAYFPERMLVRDLKEETSAIEKGKVADGSLVSEAP